MSHFAPSSPEKRITRRQALQAAGGLALAWAASPWLSRVAWAADGPAKKVLFFTKSSGFEHGAIKDGEDPKVGFARRTLTELGSKHGFEVTTTKDGGIFTPDKIKDFDAFVFYTTGDLTTPGTDKNPPMSKEGKAAFLDAIKAGKGFAAVHSGSDTFHSPGHDKIHNGRNPEMDPYIQMLGGEFIIHGAQQKGVLKSVDAKFPGAPVSDLTIEKEEWYALKNFSKDLHVILLQDTADMKGWMYERKPYPETWARMHGKGRVFFSSMGHEESVWKHEAYQKLLVGALGWITGRVDADVTPNIEHVAPDALADRYGPDAPPAAPKKADDKAKPKKETK